jgi:hypothetical protein
LIVLFSKKKKKEKKKKKKKKKKYGKGHLIMIRLDVPLEKEEEKK